jgi:hypothetical protein
MYMSLLTLFIFNHSRLLCACAQAEPNARFQARRRAEAERTLFAVACKPLFGSAGA